MSSSLSRRFLFRIPLVALICCCPLFAVEPWADRALPHVDGVTLWLDAAKEGASRQLPSSSPLKDGSRLDRWRDASGNKRDVVQGDSQRQPRLVQVGSAADQPDASKANWVVRFDGEDDHLRALDVNQKLTDFTLFLVAAPHSNFGMFRGLFACNQRDRRDYETGFTLDLNAPGSALVSDFNLEGRGFGGARNLMKGAAPFGTLHVIECIADSQAKKVRLVFDGREAGTREFSPSELIADEITVGARFYTNGPGAQQVRGFLHGDLAEVILFNRVLSTEEARDVRSHLDAKHSALREALPKALPLATALANAEPLVPVKNPPPIQMLVPGFSVFELPVDLTNLNSIRYRADGQLFALGYNGNIWLLHDTNGDGFEDKAELFFDNPKQEDGVPFLRGPIGMSVIPFEHPVLRRDVKGPAPWRKGRGEGPQQPANDSIPASDIARLAPLSAEELHELRTASGVIVASKGKVSAIIDQNGDGKADVAKVIASGWKEISQNVDAVGVAIGYQGDIYFGLGTAAYNNAYLLDEAGKAHYDLEGQNGTIQRILPDLSRRETVCTGIRFPIGLAVDRGDLDGDSDEALIASEQEGATWLPNGNPFDELLHIRPGRHYGFPPRHPRHLPGVFDEPSVFDYAPQHQSTCGIAFNLPRPFSYAKTSPLLNRWDKALFGPESWKGDLFVTGESRGKLYRTRLKVSHGEYAAQNHLIACLNMLTVDCCLSPKGDLVVACHSGGPDWGTGPTGPGKLFVIRYSQTEVPQPLAAWSAGPQEVRIAFDRPLDPLQLRNLTSQTSISYGEFVAAGDRFESLRPGYAVVQRQVATPRFKLPVHGVGVTSDRKTLVIATAPHRVATQYAITLPGLGRTEDLRASQSGEEAPASGAPRPLSQLPQIDLAYSLNGVVATWEPADPAGKGWSGVLPHLDLQVCDKLSNGDAEAERFRECLKQRGTLTLETQLDLRNLVHPAVQPGSKLDHEWPEQTIFVGLSGPELQMAVNGKSHPADSPTVERNGQGQTVAKVKRVLIPVSSFANAPTTLKLTVTTGDESFPVRDVEWWSSETTQPRALHLSRFLVPWASLSQSDSEESDTRREIPELAGGSWGRGRRVFFSDEAGCSKCHLAHGTGGRIGPDLSNLVHRDYASVARDVTLPSFAINPDYLASVVTLHDGRVLTGIVRSPGEAAGLTPSPTGSASPTVDPGHLLVADKDGVVRTVARTEVDEVAHSPISVMPEGIPQKLGPERMVDLLTFLLTAPPQMPWDAKLPPPKPRSRAEVVKVLAPASLPPSAEPKKTEGTQPTPARRPLRILLVAGAKDHGPGEHDYPAWQRTWSELLRGAEGVAVDTAMEWPSAEQIADADVIAFFQKGRWDETRAAAMDKHLAQGRGLVYIHWAVEGDVQAPAFAQRIGLASQAAKLKFRHGPLDLSFKSLGLETGSRHPIGRNFDQVHFHDESYWQMQGDPTRIQLIATGVEEDEPRPLFWTYEPPVANAKEQGRVFVSILGHYSWTFDDPLFRILLLRGIAWTAKEDVDRFNELATLGASLAD